MIKYDEQKLIRSLEVLPNFARVAFAAACAERQMADYARVTRKSDGFGSVVAALDSIWSELMGAPTRDDIFRRHLAVCMSAMAEPESPEAMETDDAIASVAYTLRARLRGDSQEAAWAARTTYASLDYYLGGLIPSTEFTREVEQRILAHPLMQAELERQRRDLSDLTELVGDKGNVISTIVGLRARAKEAAQHFTGSVS